MVSYLAMFGLMFADVGQGAVLVFAGLVALFSFKQKREGLFNLAKLMVWCGASSMVTGVLFGSYFGMPWMKPLWFDFHGIIAGHPHKVSLVSSIYDVLEITIYFGIGIIGVGLLFNWVNLILKRRWIELILDRRGLLGGWFYFGGIYTARFMILHDYRQFPPADVLFYLVGIPALLLFVKAPEHFFSERKQGSGKRFTLMTPMDFAMEWIVELLELFSGYLSNTLSFMRVAGLGIAHATLMISFFELARMASGQQAVGALLNPWAILIIVFGNILVIGLEGLTAGVQALRLNYYEFFSKFFRGSGEVYSPVSLKSRV
jgi:V/A-type H+-transporting ATPase subunit I